MTHSPRAETTKGRATWPLLLGALAILLPGPILCCLYIIADWAFVRTTLRAMQLIVLLALGALALGLLGAIAVAVTGLWTRWASPRAREAGTVIAVARARWPQLPDEARVSLTIGHPPREHAERVPLLVEPAPAIEAAAPPQLPPPAPPVGQVLKSLERQGHICRSGNSLMVGYDATAGVPVYAELADACLIALGGAPQTGKTSLALFLIAQAAMMGWPLYICDPHGRHERGIISRGAPVSGMFARQAIERHEIADTIAAFDALGRARINSDPDRTPAFLVIDEFPALALSGELAGQMEVLIRIGSQYPKVGLFVIAIGYEWNAQLFASPFAAPLRHLSRHRAAAQCDPGSAKFLVGERLAAQAATLATGEILFVASGVFGVVRVPLIGHEDLCYAASGTPPRPYEPMPEPEPTLIAGEPPALTLAERVVELLSQADAPMTSRAIIDALAADERQVQTRLGDLVEAGKVRRSGTRGSYRYSLTHTQGVSPGGDSGGVSVCE